MTKWEYCVITGGKSKQPGFGTFCPGFVLFTKSGPKIKNLRGRGPDGSSEEDRVVRLIAQLGEVGWEMVGCGSTGGVAGESHHSIYFKRPIPDKR